DAICATVTQLQALSPVPLLLENLDYCPTGAYEHVCMPDFITAVLETTGTWMLLDLAHAQVSAAALGFPWADYLAQLPLHRVRQLHVSSPRQVNGRLIDAHDPLREADFQLLAQMVARTQPWAITLEYTRDAGTLECQARRLSALYPGKDGS
ncbi:MAG: DUF692 family protein, partial [Anaerolineae bacterium]|nr:DUF692 family protein [Anaerolineae bacterium]